MSKGIDKNISAWGIFKIPCKEATQLIVRSEEYTLKSSARLALQLHLAICSSCRKFKVQSALIDRTLWRIGKDILKTPVMNETQKIHLQSIIDNFEK
jgi:hypothetical protein